MALFVCLGFVFVIFF